MQLRHTRLDGTWHIDLLISTQPAGGVGRDDHCLVAFRLDRPLWEYAVGETCEALRLFDHRARYLSFEGRLSGDRGEVRRVASGRVFPLCLTDDKMTANSTWRIGRRNPVEVPFVITRRIADRWRLDLCESINENSSIAFSGAQSITSTRA